AVTAKLVRTWSAYENYVPKVKAGHVLAQVKSSLVEAPIMKRLGRRAGWFGLNPTLPIYM
ncbi:hypothetical protein EDC04DRAFT_2756587, partial [Pisolithus marmoratus]